ADEDILTIGRGGGRAVRVGAVRRLLLGVGDLFFPELLAIGAVEADQAACVVLIDRLGDEDAITPDDRGGVAALRKRDLPLDVLGRPPFQWQVLLDGMAIPARTTPGGPVVRERG